MPWAWSAAVGAALGALYLVLAPPVTGPKDCGEFTLVLTFGGAAHPTGYPVYVVLGHLFVHALLEFLWEVSFTLVTGDCYHGNIV